MNILITFHTPEAARKAFLATEVVGALKYDQQSRIKFDRGGWITFRSCETTQEVQRLAGLSFQAIIPGDKVLPEEIQQQLRFLVRTDQ